MQHIDREWLRRIGAYIEGDAVIGQGDGLPMDTEEGSFPPSEKEAKAGSNQPPESGEQSLSIPEDVAKRLEEQEEEELSHQHNIFGAPKAFSLDGRYLRRLASQFARMVSKVAEDSADMPVQGDDEWDHVELVQRRFSGRGVNQCRMTREKRKVAVVLDSSPSCVHQARLFGAIATVAERLGDCELYDAPNFYIHAHKQAMAWENYKERGAEWDFSQRVVLAFGDFDGIDIICEASKLRGNRIYWFSCEERPEVLNFGREKLVTHFKGVYLPANNMEQLMKAMRRVR